MTPVPGRLHVWMQAGPTPTPADGLPAGSRPLRRRQHPGRRRARRTAKAGNQAPITFLHGPWARASSSGRTRGSPPGPGAGVTSSTCSCRSRGCGRAGVRLRRPPGRPAGRFTGGSRTLARGHQVIAGDVDRAARSAHLPPVREHPPRPCLGPLHPRVATAGSSTPARGRAPSRSSRRATRRRPTSRATWVRGPPASP